MSSDHYGGAKAERALHKYCSILTYVEHKNRELYDAIHDLCKTGLFSMRKGAALTFLMPARGGPFHNKIISIAYSEDPTRAVELIQACILLENVKSLGEFKERSYPNSLQQAVVVEKVTSNAVSIKGDGGIVEVAPAKDFVPLYTSSNFSIFEITSGMMSTSSPSMAGPQLGQYPSGPSRGRSPRGKREHTAPMEAEGGAWAELQSSSDRPSQRDLANAAIEGHLASLTNKGGKMPDWLKGTAVNNTFARWGVSLAQFFIDTNRTEMSDLVSRLYHPNPMCVIPFTCLFVNDSDYRAWLEHKDSSSEYTYAKYQSFVARPTSDSGVKDIVAECMKKVTTRGNQMCDVASCVSAKYHEAYEDGVRKLLYDEGVFLLNSYVRHAVNGKFDDCRKIAKIVLDHYCDGNSKPMLSGCSPSSIPADVALYCKLMEFVLSETFMWPNTYSTSGSPLPDYAEPKPPITTGEPRLINFAPKIAEYFSH